jgi:hypothetical protein
MPPVFLSDRATLTFAPARDGNGARVVMVTWHQGEEIEWSERMTLTALDVRLLRDYCDAWLACANTGRPPGARLVRTLRAPGVPRRGASRPRR